MKPSGFNQSFERLLKKKLRRQSESDTSPVDVFSLPDEPMPLLWLDVREHSWFEGWERHDAIKRYNAITRQTRKRR